MTDKSSQASYVMSLSTLSFGAFTLQEWIALAGLVLAIGTFGTNFYFRWKADQRDRRRMELLEKEAHKDD